MEREDILANITVGEIRSLLVKEPTVVHPDQGEREILEKILEDPRTRHVYVVDDEGVLIGVVRMNMIVEYLFPSIVASEEGMFRPVSMMRKYEQFRVVDLMNDTPRFVYESTSLLELAAVFIREKINELPVVDENHRLIGQVCVYEIIKAYLEETARYGQA